MSTRKPDFRAEKEFGLIVGGILFALGAWWLYRDKFEIVRTAFLAIGFLLVLFGMVMPRTLVFPNKAWMFLARILSSITTPIILGVIYFGVIMPIGLFKRMFGWDPLERRGKEKESYWNPYQEYQRDSRHYEKMF